AIVGKRDRRRRMSAERRRRQASGRRAPGDAGVSGSRGERPGAVETPSERLDQRAALAPGKPEADGGDARRARELQPVRGPVHLGRGGVEDEPGRADEDDGHQRHHRAAPERALVGEHVGGDQRLAVPRPRGMEDAVSEAEADEPPSGARVAVQRMDLRRHEMGELRLFGQKPAGDPPLAPAAPLAAADRERARLLRQRRRAPGEKGGGSQTQWFCERLRHGHATMALPAILKPKLVPGERLVKKDSVSFVLSAGSRAFALVTETEQPEGGETRVTGFLSSNSKSMKYSGSATRNVMNLTTEAGVLRGKVT